MIGVIALIIAIIALVAAGYGVYLHWKNNNSNKDVIVYSAKTDKKTDEEDPLDISSKSGETKKIKINKHSSEPAPETRKLNKSIKKIVKPKPMNVNSRPESPREPEPESTPMDENVDYTLISDLGLL